MMDVTVMAAVSGPRRWCRRRGGAGHGAHTTTDGRADPRATPATGDSADHRTRAGTEQPAAERALAGIIRVRRGYSCANQCRADHACNSRLPRLSHLWTFQAGLAITPLYG
jgi:hypothetical protein